MEYDSETGNYYDYARYYNPRLGRFMTPDPSSAGAVAGNPQSWNAYSYVLNNPETFVDPEGLYCVDSEGNAVHINGGMPTKNKCAAPGRYWLTVNGKARQHDEIVVSASGQSMLLGSAAGSSGLQAPPPVRYQQKQRPHESLAACASNAAESVSIAADLHKVPGLKSGVGGFVANALLGNPFSGVTDLLTSFATGEAGGHNVLYNMALGAAAGPSQGFGSVIPGTEGTVFGASPADAALGLGLGVEWATGVAEANVVFSGFTYFAAGAACLAGWAQ